MRSLLLSLVLLAVLAPAAQAELTWSAAQTVSTDGTNGSAPDIAFDAAGGAVAAWREFEGGRQRIRVADRSVRGFLGTSVPISPADRDSIGPRVFVARDGTAYALWMQPETPGGDVYDIAVVSRPAGGSWGTPENVTPTPQPVFFHDAVIQPDGRLLLTYSRRESATQVSLVYKTKNLNAESSGFTTIWTGTGAANTNPAVRQADIAMDAAGYAVFAWIAARNAIPSDNFGSEVFAARKEAGPGLETAKLLADRGTHLQLSDVHAAINGSRSVVTWSRTIGAGMGTAEYAVRSGTGTGAWSAVQTAVGSQADNDPGGWDSVVDDRDGNVAATYVRGYDANPNHGDLYLSAGQTAFPAPRAYPAGVVRSELFGTDDTGAASLTYVKDGKMFAGRRTPGANGTYTAGFDLGAVPASRVAAVGPDGTTAIAYVAGDGVNDRVLVRFGDNPAPVPPEETPAPVPTPPPPPPAPVPSAIQAVERFTAGKAGVLTVNVSGQVDQLEWTISGRSGSYFGSSGQRSIRFRLNGPATVVVKATGPGGTQSFSRAISGQSAPTDADGRKVADGAPRSAATVVATGAEAVLTGKSSACGPVNLDADALLLSGCMKPAATLGDIPAGERGVLDPIASAYGLARSNAGLMSRAVEVLDGYVITGTATINGLWPVVPAGGASVVAFPQASALTSSNAAVRVAGSLVKPAGSGFSLRLGGTPGPINLGTVPRPATFPRLGRFPYSGDFSVELGGGSAKVVTRLKLPDFVERNGINVQPLVGLYASPDALLQVDGMKLGPMDVGFGLIALDDLTVAYSAAADEWVGGMSACLFDVGCLDFKPPVGAVKLAGNELTYARTGLAFDPPKPLAPPAVYLNSLTGGFALNPSRVFGGATISLGGFVKLEGREVFAAPSTATPYLLKRDEVGESFPAAMYSTPFTRPLVAAGGDVGLDLPVIGFTKLGGGYLLYELPGYVAVGGNASFDVLGIIRYGGGINGEMDLVKQRYNLHGDIRACLIAVDDDLCAGSVSNVSRGPGLEGGAGGCLDLGPVSVGGGVQWARPGAPFIWPIDGCKWSKFKIDVRSRRQAATGTTVTLGDDPMAIQLDGDGESPQVKVTGPNGETLDTSGGRLVHTPDAKVRIVRFDTADAHFTTVGLQDAAKGDWRIEPLLGSATIVSTSTATDPPDAKVTGKVKRGKGDKRVLTYDVRRRPDQEVSFFDVEPRGGRKLIGTTAGGRGSITFTPGPGKGKHKIVASFALNDIGAEERDVTTFTPPPPTLAAPRGLKVRRSGTTVRVSWRGVPGATRYELALVAGDQRFLETAKRTASFTKVPKAAAGTVTVRATGNLRQSKVARKAFKRTAKRKQPLRSLKKCTVRKKRVRCR